MVAFPGVGVSGWKAAVGVDAQDRVMTVASQQITGQQPRTMLLKNWRFDPQKPAPFEATRLRWEVPTETIDVEVPIEFRDLPLP